MTENQQTDTEQSEVSSDTYISAAEAQEAIELCENRVAGGFNKMINDINNAINQYSKCAQTNFALLRGTLGGELTPELEEYKTALENQEAEMLQAFEEERQRIEEIAAQAAEEDEGDEPEAQEEGE